MFAFLTHNHAVDISHKYNYRSTGTGGTVSGSESVACSVGERSIDIGQLEPRFAMKVSASCNQLSCRPAAFCRRLLRVDRTLRACCQQQRTPFPEKRARFREPASSVNERSFPARPGTGGAESTQATGRVAAEMCSVTGTSMPAELLRQTTVIHHFPTHAC